jgi:hypothetical protein
MGIIREDAIDAGIDQSMQQVRAVGGVGEDQETAVMDVPHNR